MIAIGLAAGCLGSVIGTILMAIHDLYLSPNVYPKNDLSTVAMVVPVIAMMSLFGTLPGTALIGAPILYAVRYRIASRPMLWLVPVVGVAILVAFVALSWAFRAPLGSDYRDIEILVFYPAGCAIGLVTLLGLWGRATGRRSNG